MNFKKSYLFNGILLFILSSCSNTTSNLTETIVDTSAADSIVPLIALEITEKKIPFPKNVEIFLPTHYRKESNSYPNGVKEKRMV